MKTYVPQNGTRSWTEYFRIITPFLLVVITAIGTLTNTKLDGIDDKLFKHLTNDEVHSPRSITVNRAEFEIYQSFRAKEMEALRSGIDDLKRIQQEYLSAERESMEKLDALYRAIGKNRL